MRKKSENLREKIEFLKLQSTIQVANKRENLSIFQLRINREKGYTRLYNLIYFKKCIKLGIEQ